MISEELESVIVKTAGEILVVRKYVTTRDVYAALPGTPSMHRKGKKEPSLLNISRVLVKNGYRPEGKARGGYTHYVKP